MHLLEASTNQLGCVGWVHPKPLPTEYGSLMGFAWVGLLATLWLLGSEKTNSMGR